MKPTPSDPTRLLAVMTLLLAGLPAPAAAGRVLFGAHLAGNRLEDARLPPGTNAGAESLRPAGEGFDVQFGYRCGGAVPLRLSFGHTRHDTSDPHTPFSDTQVLLELDYLFAAGHPVRPYLSAGIGAIALHPDHVPPEVETRGGMATLGAGFLYRLGAHFSLDVNARAEFINWTDAKTRVIEPDGTTVTVEQSIRRRSRGGRVAAGFIWWL